MNCLNENCLTKIKVIKPKLRKLPFPEIVHHQQGSKESSRVSGSQCFESTLFEFPVGRRLSRSNDVFSRRRQQPSNCRMPSERRRQSDIKRCEHQHSAKRKGRLWKECVVEVEKQRKFWKVFANDETAKTARSSSLRSSPVFKSTAKSRTAAIKTVSSKKTISQI